MDGFDPRDPRARPGPSPAGIVPGVGDPYGDAIVPMAQRDGLLGIGYEGIGNALAPALAPLASGTAQQHWVADVPPPPPSLNLQGPQIEPLANVAGGATAAPEAPTTQLQQPQQLRRPGRRRGAGIGRFNRLAGVDLHEANQADIGEDVAAAKDTEEAARYGVDATIGEIDEENEAAIDSRAELRDESAGVRDEIASLAEQQGEAAAKIQERRDTAYQQNVATLKSLDAEAQADQGPDLKSGLRDYDTRGKTLAAVSMAFAAMGNALMALGGKKPTGPQPGDLINRMIQRDNEKQRGLYNARVAKRKGARVAAGNEYDRARVALGDEQDALDYVTAKKQIRFAGQLEQLADEMGDDERAHVLRRDSLELQKQANERYLGVAERRTEQEMARYNQAGDRLLGATVSARQAKYKADAAAAAARAKAQREYALPPGFRITDLERFKTLKPAEREKVIKGSNANRALLRILNEMEATLDKHPVTARSGTASTIAALFTDDDVAARMESLGTEALAEKNKSAEMGAMDNGTQGLLENMIGDPVAWFQSGNRAKRRQVIASTRARIKRDSAYAGISSGATKEMQRSGRRKVSR